MATAISSCVLAPPIYWGRAIEGRVIDAETGQPIEGAVVVADWKLYGGGMGHGGHKRSLFVGETVTDANGRFTFHRWGPKLRPMTAVLDTAPWLLIFKSGYEHRYLLNDYDSNAVVRQSDWNGRDIAMTPFRGTVEQRLQMLLGVLADSGLQSRMLREIQREQSRYPSWPGEGPAFFEGVRNLLRRGPNATTSN